MTKDVIYVDEQDNQIGYGSIENGRVTGAIVRIARILLLNSEGNVLLQQRSPNIAFPLLWNESATGHVDRDEEYVEAAVRELKEELGVSGVALKEVSKIYCEEPLPSGQLKKAFHALYLGTHDGTVNVDPEEVHDTRWVSIATLQKELEEKSDTFTPGAQEGLKEFLRLIPQTS